MRPLLNYQDIPCSFRTYSKGFAVILEMKINRLQNFSVSSLIFPLKIQKPTFLQTRVKVETGQY